MVSAVSLLDGGSQYEPCTVYLQESVTDMDGNIRTRPSTTGTAAVARFQPQSSSGTSARLQESDNEGFESSEVYMMRFPRSFTTEIGPQSEVEWRGSRWAIFGYATRRNCSPATAHVTYTIKRY